jgi:hypothetical protein
MTLTLVGTSKNGKRAFYTGASHRQNYAVEGFVGEVAPKSFEVPDGVFTPGKQPKAKLTKEERAALPKPTLAEKIAKREAALAALKAKAAAEEQPSL